MKKEYSELKKRALLAKQRLKMGYFERITAQKEELNARGESLATKIEVSKVEKDRILRENLNVLQDAESIAMENLYLKVCKMLDENINVTDPIGRLIDNDEYKALDFQAKQRYILQMIKKYNILRERYYRERAVKTIK